MKIAIVPIMENKSGNSRGKANYRPIALVTACSKISESCLLIVLEKYLHTHDQQFGFKSQHATDMCIFIVKSVIKYTKQNSTVFTPFLDAAKAFDRVSHWTLFSKMIKRIAPLVIVRIIAFCNKRRQCVLNGVKLTPRTLMFQMEYAKVGYCHQKYLLYMLMICHIR